MGECAGAFYWPLVRVPRARMGARVPPNCQQKRDQGVNPGESDQQGGQKALRSKALSCAQPQRFGRTGAGGGALLAGVGPEPAAVGISRIWALDLCIPSGHS